MQPRDSDEQPKQLYLAGVLKIARRRWWTLLAGAAAGVVLVAVAGAATHSGYEGSVKLLVGPIGGGYTELRAASRQAETYADIATSAPVLEAARGRVRARPAIVSAKADYFTRVLTISARTSGRRAAAAAAGAVAGALIRATGPRRTGTPGELTLLGPAETSPAAGGARRRMLAALAGLAGLLAMLTLLVSIDRRRPVGAVTGLPAGAA